MRWNRAPRAGRTDKLISRYFERQIEQIEVPPPPAPLGGAATPDRRPKRERRVAPPARGLPNLVCALAIAAGLAVVALNVDRPSSLATLVETQALRYQWTTVIPGTLTSVQKTISTSLNGG